MFGKDGNAQVGNISELVRHVDSLIEKMRSLGAIQLLNQGKVTLEKYQSLLMMLFHQTYNAPLTFALAAANCPNHHTPIREYLLKHALEEKDHWQWALNDLSATGVNIDGIIDSAAPVSCAAFVAFNFYLAHKIPFARMGTALFLETMSARIAPDAAKKLALTLGLTPNQMSFFIGHAEADQVHAQDLINILIESNLSQAEYGQLAWAATTSANLYMAMYDESIGRIS